jgi:hypothetical protein
VSAPARRTRRLSGSLWLFGFVLATSAGGIAILGLQASRGSSFSAYSTYRAEPDGASACHDVLGHLGFDCRRETTGLDLLEDDGSLAVLVEPFPKAFESRPKTAPARAFEEEPPMSPREVDSLVAWVRRGGRLLVFEGHANPLYDALGIEVGGNPTVQDVSEGRPAALSPVTVAAGRINLATRATLRGKSGDWAPLYLGDGGPVVLTATLGKGHVHAVADPNVVSNEGIVRPGNVELVKAIADDSPTGSRVVRFDELRHGFSAERNVMGFARRHGLHLAALQGVLAFVMVAWAATRPKRRVRGAEIGKGIESREFITAMANIYARARLEQHAAQSWLRRLERALALALGSAPAAIPREQLASRLRALGIQNYRGWDSIQDEARELGLALSQAGPVTGIAEPRKPRPSLRTVGERRLLAFARTTTQLEREVREAARIRVEQVIA